jgi:glycosyltransferase involved in cell wall biosynthesis
MNKINILLDSKILVDQFFNKASSRSGVFFVAWNVLQILQENKKFRITLTYPSEYEYSYNLKKLKKTPYFFKFKFININIKELEIAIIQRIEKHKKKRNYIKMFYNCLRLVKIKIKEELYDKDIFKKVHIYLSPYYAIHKNILIQKHIKKFYILYDTIPIILPEYVIYANDVIKPVINTFDTDIFSFCISKNCKNDFLTYCGDKLDENKMFVTHIATSQHYVPRYDQQELVNVLSKYNVNHNPNDKYLFSLCNFEPRKNVPFTIACFCKFVKKHNIQDLFFYIGGGAYSGFVTINEEILKEATVLKNKIKFLGYIEDIDINILYSNSMFFTFLSQYEGFGMPPLEAMQAGTPVITSNNSSLPEVVGDAAITLTYNDEDAVIKAFENFYFNKDLRKEYIARGLERAKMFNWEKCVGEMTKIIEDVV